MSEDSKNLEAPQQAVSKAEIEEIMADDGYSADQRKTWLKSALTATAAAHDGKPSDDAKEVVEDLKERLDGLDNPSGASQKAESTD